MKCAEAVTLAPIHFINKLLRKLISHPEPLDSAQEHVCVAENATVNKKHSPLTRDTYSIMTHRCLLAYKKIQIAVSV